MSSTAQQLAPDDAAPVRRRLLTGVVAIIALMVGGSLVLITSARSYILSTQILAAYAIWDDTQLVVFVHTGVLGGTSPFLEQLRAQTGTLLGQHKTTTWRRWSNVTSVVRYEGGVVTPMTHVNLDRNPAGDFLFTPRPRFVNGRALVVAGFWNGRAIERLPAQEYLRLSRDPAPDDPGRWHASQLLQDAGVLEVPVQVRGAAAALHVSRSEVEAVIDLVRPGAAPVRLFETKLAPHVVSEREYESSLKRESSGP